MSDRASQRQVLSFRLGNEIYGVDILAVKEIRGWAPVTRIPHAAAHVLGVLNLRGAIVPIVDLRRRFRLASAEFTAQTVVIVVSLATPAGQRECGLVVDAVSDVVDLAADALRAPPEISTPEQADLIAGLAQVDDRMLILLDAMRLVVRELAGAAEKAA
ncbi:purine-binding chemotaxis protein CheW [bacterium]|nr:MAG: purine-binding chemotaxis protein CheW [bacterium]